MTPLKFIRNVLAALTGQTAPSQLAGAVALGMMVALIPKANLTAQLLLLVLILSKANFALAAASTALFLPFTPLTDRLADKLGYLLLVEAGGLRPVWTWLYRQPLVPWTAFNNTLVLGNLVLGLLLFAPVYLAAERGAAWYQKTLRERVMKYKVVQMAKASYLYKLFFPELPF